jgi:SAM-dependent methyltransferase
VLVVKLAADTSIRPGITRSDTSGRALLRTAVVTVYTLRNFAFTDYPSGSRVLDVGFGSGEQMRSLVSRGCQAFGIELHPARAVQGRQNGLLVCRARAERIPFATGSFDGLVSRVVMPYTDEALVIAEISRVLRPGAIAKLSYHGLGYPLHIIATEANWRRQVYAARTLVNSWLYTLTRMRLPGFWGSALYQSRGRLRRYYREVGLELVEDTFAPHFLGAPVFIYHTVRRIE